MASLVSEQVVDASTALVAACNSILTSYPKNVAVGAYKYGTAGFRMEQSLLDRPVAMSGVVAALRAITTGKATGVMITASHNPPKDNGVKLVDIDGGMLSPEWEQVAVAAANASSDAEMRSIIVAAASGRGMDSVEKSTDTALLLALDAAARAIDSGLAALPAGAPVPSAGAKLGPAGWRPALPIVVVARDTRDSGPRLQAACEAGASAVLGPVWAMSTGAAKAAATGGAGSAGRDAPAAGPLLWDLGVAPTPALHHAVRAANAPPNSALRVHADSAGYCRMLAGALRDLVQGNRSRFDTWGPGSGAEEAAEEEGEEEEEEEGESKTSGGKTAAGAASGDGSLPGTGSEGQTVVVVDCAGGVGGVIAPTLQAALDDECTGLRLDCRNVPSEQEGAEGGFDTKALNVDCGAEHCQKQRLPPAGFYPAETAGPLGDKASGVEVGDRCASLDGDADRIVYHYWREAGAGAGAAASSGAGAAPEWRLLDGDKIAVLLAAALRGWLADAGVQVVPDPVPRECYGGGTAPSNPMEDPEGFGLAGAVESHLRACGEKKERPQVSMGVVQTAYANGASTRYLEDDVGAPLRTAKTGVKHLHHEAVRFDIGVYFEANGHGTVLLSPWARQLFAALGGASVGGDGEGEGRAAVARRRLSSVRWLVNQAIGDAWSDLLAVEGVLQVLGQSTEGWDGSYEDLPSRQCKQPVKDRTMLVPRADERRLVEPAPLYEKLDALCKETGGGARAFVRPSGTEDVVRVYAEASTQEQADALALAVQQAVFDLADGTGGRPA